jgi:hypothetical protein
MRVAPWVRNASISDGIGTQARIRTQIPLEDAAGARAAIESRATVGKTLLVVREESPPPSARA